MTNTLGIIIENNRPVVSSRKVAEIFEKEHRRVLQDIRELSCGDDFRLHNFVQSSYINSQDKEQPEYLMTRDGFTLLAMGFTGSKAMQWKIKYIETFNRMEAELSTPFAIPKTYAEALHLAAELEDKRLILEAKIEQDAPYTALGHALTPDQTETSIGMMATILSQTTGRKISSITLFEMLRRDNFLCFTETEKNRPRQKWIDKGIFKYRTYPVQTSRGTVYKFTPFLTPKGRAYMENRYGKKDY